MNERDHAASGSKDWNPVIRLIIENPISAINTAAILFGGGFVYASNEARVEKMEARMLRLEQQVREDLALSNSKDDRSNMRVETIAQSVNDMKVTVRGIETAVQYLVQQAQQQQRNERRGPQ